ncbi:hypothetical protein P43SY_007446 [Pythium insidiosum]|uniref:Uncharacterized protein n=1 Tax=Pythium insidiosum TaxID=114742 RepID=A0AAD5Q874_PYTIN|nr:hypothetical protein P43SY_007446 [Pythium insidiosum]
MSSWRRASPVTTPSGPRDLADALPTDEAALREELRLVDERISRIQHETDEEFVHGCEVLLACRQQQITSAYDRFERLQQTARMLHAHECRQARERYVARCEQLKQDMSNEIQREIRRLQQSRDGVSVMDRRRPSRHMGPSSSSVNSGGVGSAQAATHGLALFAAASASASAPGDGSDLSFSGIGYDTAAMNEDRVAMAQLAEKRRLEVLLSATPVFAPLNKVMAPDEIAADLAQLQRVVTESERAAARAGQDSELLWGAGSSGNPSPAAGVKRRRLLYNPSMLQEGQEIAVYSASPARALVLAGVITAATSTRVFVKTASGRFESVAVQDWKEGRVSVHAVEPRSS